MNSYSEFRFWTDSKHYRHTYNRTSAFLNRLEKRKKVSNISKTFITINSRVMRNTNDTRYYTNKHSSIIVHYYRHANLWDNVVFAPLIAVGRVIMTLVSGIPVVGRKSDNNTHTLPIQYTSIICLVWKTELYKVAKKEKWTNKQTHCNWLHAVHITNTVTIINQYVLCSATHTCVRFGYCITLTM